MDIAHANLDSSLSKDCVLLEGLSAEEICREIKRQKAEKWTVQYTWGHLVLFLFKECRGKIDLNQMGWNKIVFVTPYLSLVNHIHQTTSRRR